MIDFAVREQKVVRVLRAMVIPKEGMADQIKELYNKLFLPNDNYRFYHFTKSMDIKIPVDKLSELKDPAEIVAFQLGGFGKEELDDKKLSIGGKETFITNRYARNIYAGSIRLLFEAMNGQIFEDQELSDMLGPGVFNEKRKASNIHELKRLIGDFRWIYEYSPDFAVFYDRVKKLVDFEQVGETKTIELGEKPLSTELPIPIICGLNNMNILRLARKVPDFMGR